MISTPLVSIVVNNYNYDRFLEQAIESALRQTYRRTEVLVVDDGSTDNSRAVIASFGNRISEVLKDNQGQASAFNAGQEASHGDVIVFLDADDTLLPFAVDRAVEQLREEDVVKVHWHLWEMDEEGRRTGRIMPGYSLAEGDLLPETLRFGVPRGWRHGLGHAWRRPFLERVMPVRECGDKHGADAYLCALSPIFGRIHRIDEPLGCYRTHESNFARGREVRYRLQRDARRYPFLFRWIRHYLSERDISVDTRTWFGEGSPYAWTQAALALHEEIDAMNLTDQCFILVDGGLFGSSSFTGARPMMEHKGEFWGPPEDDHAAIEELERQRLAGAAWIVVAANCFWWFDHYRELVTHLQERYLCVRRNEFVVAFDLQRQIRDRSWEKGRRQLAG